MRARYLPRLEASSPPSPPSALTELVLGAEGADVGDSDRGYSYWNIPLPEEEGEGQTRLQLVPSLSLGKIVEVQH